MLKGKSLRCLPVAISMKYSLTVMPCDVKLGLESFSGNLTQGQMFRVKPYVGHGFMMAGML